MHWRVYYGDGLTYSDRDGSLYDAPRVDVQAIAIEQPPPTPPRIIQGKDFYIWREDLGWIGCDWGGLFDYLMLSPGPKTVLFGRAIRDDIFWEVVKRAVNEGVG